ncbi:MAG: sigma-70 family RNA polymerase sigma factor [Planctomycetota bacterium]|nr:MAG: sigma-70 family RNA polymerase sigma factor [Planctomycetota bacterium]
MAGKSATTFEELAVPHIEAVFRVARRLARNLHEAEDLVQETYLKAYKAFDRFELREYGIRPWLLRILHNTFLNRRVRENKAPRATEQAALERVPDEGLGDGSDSPPDLDFENVDQEVLRAIDDLPDEFRSVILLWATMELRYQDIADVLEVPIGTVMSRLHRARRQLNAALADYAREHGLVTKKS